MEKQFVTYEIAKKLKELGFDEECFGYYTKQHDDSYHLCIYQQEDEHSKDRLEAPLWQQAIDWFDKWEITIDITAEECDDGDSGDGPMFVYFIQDWRRLKRYSLAEQYLTRYEAREKAILKAIELCQQKEY